MYHDCPTYIWAVNYPVTAPCKLDQSTEKLRLWRETYTHTPSFDPTTHDYPTYIGAMNHPVTATYNLKDPPSKKIALWVLEGNCSLHGKGIDFLEKLDIA